ncbi:MAG TPA: hypothetical protein VEP90_13875 [Methylomirabilota bacterium]|nr:hypothetical protein [Methylomirabilota bacterium]
MSSSLTTIDIRNYPELLRLVEEVATTKKPRELKRVNKIVAVLSPAISENKEKWETIRATFGSWSDLDTDELIANIHRWRQEESRPATRP